MKRYCSLLLALSNVFAPAVAVAAQRPHYGGVLRVAAKEAPGSLDPAVLAAAGPAGVSILIYETLTRLNQRGAVQHELATAWQAESGYQRWRISLRSGVTFDDGTPLDSAIVAASLRNSNPDWKVQAAGDSVIIETPAPDPDLPAELALPRNGIVLHNVSKLNGTGPFVVLQWDPGKHLVLTANERYWQGRAFVDTIEFTFGRSDRDQITLFDLNKADLIELSAESIRRAQNEGRTLRTSQPRELLALLFPNDAKSDDGLHAHNALSLSIDTAALNNVVMQGGGEPSRALLPNWLSGYAFAFAAESNASPRTRVKAQPPTSWTLAYDASDPTARIITERIMLNARDVGITLQLAASASSPDLRLVRVPLASCDPRVALRRLAQSFQLSEPKFTGGAIPDLYSAELNLLQSRRIIPLLYLRSAAALRPNVQGFDLTPDGAWELANVWLAAEKP